MECWEKTRTKRNKLFYLLSFECSILISSVFSIIPLFHYSMFFHQFIGGLNLLNLRALETTVTDDRAIAPAAKMGLSRIP